MLKTRTDSKARQEGDGRLLELEGLRAVAAIVVVVFHFLVLFYPSMFYGEGHVLAPVQHMRWEDNVYGLPVSAVLSGAFAVAIFFVLSGFVLTVGFFRSGDLRVIQKLAAKRYVRLMLPALASIIIAWLALSLGAHSAKESAELISSAGSSSSLWAFPPHFLDAIWQGFVGIFTSTLGAAHYNPVLWTMQYEFIGSFLIFALVLLFGQYRLRWVIYIVATAMLWNTWFIGFVAGMVLADIFVHKRALFNLRGVWAWSFVALALYLGSYPYTGGATLYSWSDFIPIGRDALQVVCLTLASIILLYVVLASRRVGAFFAHRYLSRLGKYTFSLYLTHLLVLFTVYPLAFTLLYAHFGYNLSVLISIVITIPFVVIATWLFERYVDSPAIKLSSRIERWLFDGSRPVSQGKKV